MSKPHSRPPLKEQGISRSWDNLQGFGSVPSSVGSSTAVIPELQILRTRLGRMRAGCRWAHRETGIGSTADRLLRSGVLGSQTPMPRPRAAEVRGSKSWKRVQALWRDWAESPSLCDWQKGLSLHSMLSLGIGHLVVDGEMLLRVRPGKPLRLEFVDPGRLPVFEFVDTTQRSIMGIRFDDNYRKEAYLLYPPPFHQVWGGTYYRAENLEEVRAAQMLHFMVPLRAHQIRGVPLLWPVLAQSTTLDAFNAAAAKNAALGAQRYGIIWEDPGALEYGGEVEPDGPETADGEEQEQPDDETADARSDEALVRQFDGGDTLKAHHLPPGVKLEPWASPFPTAAVEAFNRSVSQQIAGALGVAHDALVGDLKGVNFSAGRLGRMEQRRWALQLHGYLVEQVLKPLWRFWVARLLTSGDAGLDAGMFDALMDVEWPPPPVEPVDAKNQAEAEARLLANGTHSVIELINARGRDPLEVAAERQEAKDLGFPEIMPLGEGQGPASTDEEPDKDSGSGEEAGNGKGKKD